MLHLHIAYVGINNCYPGHLICIIISCFCKPQQIFNYRIGIIIPFIMKFQRKVSYYIEKVIDVMRSKKFQ